jgi:hypothetical protein
MTRQGDASRQIVEEVSLRLDERIAADRAVVDDQRTPLEPG